MGGLDPGADAIVCIPPEAFVKYSEATKRCIVEVLSPEPKGTLSQRVAYDSPGREAIVLGMPFFRSVSVVLDLEREAVGLGPSLILENSDADQGKSSDLSEW